MSHSKQAHRSETAFIPEPFGMIKSIKEASAWLREKGVPLSNALTTLESQLMADVSLEGYVLEAAQTVGPKKIQNIGARMMNDVVRKAAPQAAQMFILRKEFVEKMKKFMVSDSSVDNLAKKYDKYVTKDAPSADDAILEIYNNALDKMLKLDIMKDFPRLTGDVTKTVQVKEGCLITLKEMIDDMIAKRNKRLGKVSGDKKERGTHGPEMIQQLMSPDPIFTIDPKKKNSTGRFLMTTALAWSGKNPEYIARFEKVFENDPSFVDEVLRELDQLEGSSSTSVFHQQRSNIDVIFLTFFVSFKICMLSVENFYKFQRVIYGAGRSVVGREKVLSFLTQYQDRPGIHDLVSNISKSSNIHLPPFVLTVGRLQDLYCVLGPCDSYAATATITKPAVSWRYINNIKSPRSIEIAVALYQIERRAISEGADDILQSEHTLHQIFLRKTHPFQNTNMIEGNALNVHITI